MRLLVNMTKLEPTAVPSALFYKILRTQPIFAELTLIPGPMVAAMVQLLMY